MLTLLPALTPNTCVCPAIPSAPRSVISSVNETSLSLEWDEPVDSGGRGDLVYNVVCKKCLRDRNPCTRCDDNVDISPRRLGLLQRKVVVRNLQAHTRYSFEVQAVNGVSGKNTTAPRYSTVNITTNQAGEWPCVRACVRACVCACAHVCMCWDVQLYFASVIVCKDKNLIEYFSVRLLFL